MFNLKEKMDAIEYGIVTITPTDAEKLLTNNPDNRRLRPSHIEHLKDQMLQGRWMLSPEPIIFSKSGKLIDGQHRLNALIRAGMELKFVRAVVDNEEVFKVLDQGVNRSNSDITGLHPSIVGPMQYLLRCTGIKKPVAADIEQYMDSPLLKYAKFIHEDINPRDRRFKSMPFRASFCIAVGSGKADFDKCVEVYQDLASLNFSKFNNMMTEIFHQFDEGFYKQDGRSFTNEFFIRGMYLFMNVKSNKKSIRIYDNFRKEVALISRALMSEWKAESK